MRVLFVHHSLKVGGGHAITSRLIRTLGAEGHRADVFYFDDGMGQPVAPQGAIAFSGKVADLLKLLWRERYDIAHAYSDGWDYGLDLVHLLCPATKLIISGQGVVNPGWTSKTCAALTVCAQWMADAHNLVTDLPIHVIFNAVDGDEFPAYQGRVEGPPIVVWVGRVTDARKGVARLAAAVPSLRANGVRLWLACPETPSSLLEPDMRSVLESAAEFWRAVPFAQMPALYQNVAASGGCFLSTSHFEGLPLAVLEAQSSGCPVIAIDAPGVNEAASAEGGALVLSATTSGEELAKVVVKALADFRSMRIRSKACAEYTRARFSPLVERDAFLQVYKDAPNYPVRPLSSRPGWSWVDVLRRSRAYQEHWWANAEAKCQASVELRRCGLQKVAMRAAWMAFCAGPTLFIRPRRLKTLFKLW